MKIAYGTILLVTGGAKMLVIKNEATPLTLSCQSSLIQRSTTRLIGTR